MVKFNKLIQGGKYKLKGGTLFYIKKFSMGKFKIFTNEGSMDNKFAI